MTAAGKASADTHATPRTLADTPARRITRAVLVVLGAVMLSRMLGFVREWMVARQIGSGVATDAYYAAFTLPDFLNYLVASSALEVILVPIFSAYHAEEREHEAWYVFSTVVTFAAVVLCSLIVAAEIFAPQLVRAVVPGFSQSEMTQVVFLTRLMLPAQLFLCLGVIFSSAQVAHANFLIPCLGAAVSNCAIVFGGWFLAPRIGITGFAIGVLAGSFCGFFALQIIGLRRVKARFTPNLNFRHPGFRMFLRLAIPFMLALSVVVTDDWMLRWFGSFLPPASITWLAYGKMLARIPVSTVGYAVGLASFPPPGTAALGRKLPRAEPHAESDGESSHPAARSAFRACRRTAFATRLPGLLSHPAARVGPRSDRIHAGTFRVWHRWIRSARSSRPRILCHSRYHHTGGRRNRIYLCKHPGVLVLWPALDAPWVGVRQFLRDYPLCACHVCAVGSSHAQP